jgi:hypothetical protein
VLLTHPTAHEALEYAAMNEATTIAGPLPLPTERDVLTEVLRQGATQLLAQADVRHGSATWVPNTHAGAPAAQRMRGPDPARRR